MTKRWSELKRRMPAASQARVNARVRNTLASLPLAEIRKAIGRTQADMAKRLDQGQGSVSKIENATDLYLSTLRKYVEALGGQLHLTVTFGKQRAYEIERLADHSPR